MILSIFFRLAGVALPSAVDELVCVGLPIVGGSLWLLERFGADLSRFVRLFSGVLLGLGLGWVIGLHLRSPWPEALFELAISMTIILILGVLAELRGRFREAPPISELLDRGGAGVKKSDPRPKNEVDPKAS
jgi:hypothetical protein